MENSEWIPFLPVGFRNIKIGEYDTYHSFLYAMNAVHVDDKKDLRLTDYRFLTDEELTIVGNYIALGGDIRRFPHKDDVAHLIRRMKIKQIL